MLKVLIVDDEPIHRRGLANMIARLRPEYEVVDAKNGLEALEYIRENQVEILITDIQMPVMNGLQLIEQLGDISGHIKIIILSVYGHFDYAQQALKLGAFDYLLKPVDEEKVKLVFECVEKKIDKEQEQQREANHLKSKLEHLLPAVIEHKMNKLVYGTLDSDERIEIMEMFPSEICGVVIVFELDNQQAIQERGINNSIKNRIDQMLSGYGQSISFFLRDKTNNIVSVVEVDCDLIEAQQQMTESLDTVIAEVRDNFGVLMSVGIGSRFEKLFPEVSGSFKYAKKALNCKYYTGAGKVIHYTELFLWTDRFTTLSIDKCLWNYEGTREGGKERKREEKVQRKSEDKKELKKELVDALLKHDYSLARESIEKTIEELLFTGYPDVTEFVGSIARMLENHIRIVDEKLNMSYMKKLKSEINPGLTGCDSLVSLKQSVDQILKRLVGMMQEQKSNISGTIIDTCMKYIDDHYMEDLSLEAVAQEFHFSAAYFSNIFKNNTNSNFCEYLNRTRMNHAKKLLRDSSWKVYEISKMVGYQDPKYFSRLFKKECGLTPEEYRRISGRNRLVISITESNEFQQYGGEA